MAGYDLTVVNGDEDALEFREHYGMAPILCDYPDPTVEQGYVYDPATYEGLRVNGIVGNWEGNARIVDDTAYLGKTQRAVQFRNFNRSPYSVPDRAGIYMESPQPPYEVYGDEFWCVSQGICSFDLYAYYYHRDDTTDYEILPHILLPINTTFGYNWEMWVDQDTTHNHGYRIHIEHERWYPSSPWHVDYWFAFNRDTWARVEIQKTFGRTIIKVFNFWDSYFSEGSELVNMIWDYWEYGTGNPGVTNCFEVVPYYDTDFDSWLKIKNITTTHFDYVRKVGQPLPE